jgi:hypothetical protein
MTKLVNQGFVFEFSAFVVATCRPGAGVDTCRYLVGDIIGGDGGLHCGKLQPELAARLDRRVADGTFIARGDNCPGKPSEDVL